MVFLLIVYIDNFYCSCSIYQVKSHQKLNYNNIAALLLRATTLVGRLLGEIGPNGTRACDAAIMSKSNIIAFTLPKY